MGAEKKRGPLKGPSTEAVKVMLPPELATWGKQQPGGLSALVRVLLAVERQRVQAAAERLAGPAGDELRRHVGDLEGVDEERRPRAEPGGAAAAQLRATRRWECGTCGRVNKAGMKECLNCRAPRRVRG